MNKVPRYQPEYCTPDHPCGQATTYATSLNKGCACILIALISAVKNKALAGSEDPNDVHLRNELDISKADAKAMGGILGVAQAGRMTHSMIDNIRHIRAHGLVAFVDKGSGRFLVTPKGAKFLRNEPVWKTAIVDIVTGHTRGYYEPDGMITLREIMKAPEGAFWWHDEYMAVADRIDPRQPANAQSLFPVT